MEDSQRAFHETLESVSLMHDTGWKRCLKVGRISCLPVLPVLRSVQGSRLQISWFDNHDLKLVLLFSNKPCCQLFLGEVADLRVSAFYLMDCTGLGELPRNLLTSDTVDP